MATRITLGATSLSSWTNCKARVLQALRECRYSRVTFRIICRAVHQHADVLDSFGLLRARR
jgi:hypothetical protein